MIRKLRIKFVAVNMVIVSIALCIILGLVYYFTQVSLETRSVRMMQRIVNNPTTVETLIQSDEHPRLPYFMVRLDGEGNFMAPAGGSYNITDEGLLKKLVLVTQADSKRLGEIAGYHLRYCKFETPRSQFLVFADISAEQATLTSLMKTCLLIGALGFFGFLITSILLSRWAVRPVDQAMRRQKKFIADASHELKTPLTVIMTNTQLLQEHPHDAKTQEKLLENIRTMSEQMRAMIEQMLQLARTESAQAAPDFERINFSVLLSNSVLPFDSVFYERHMKLEMKIESDIFVNGSAEELRRVLEILLDNAQKYGDTDGTTTVSLIRSGRKHCRLVVADDGPPIPEKTLRLIFERFYRCDAARSRDGSFGLGLSIAQNIALRHHGKMWAESRDGKNYCYFELPRL